MGSHTYEAKRGCAQSHITKFVPVHSKKNTDLDSPRIFLELARGAGGEGGGG